MVDVTYPNGTQTLGNGTFLRDPQDIAANPGSIIWTGVGNGDPDAATDGVDTEGLTCFSGVTRAQTPTGSIAMKDIRVGDQVLTGMNRYETVYAFAHRNPNRKAEFVVIHAGDETLEVTAPHLVFLEGHDNPIRADSIKVGDVLRGKKTVANIAGVGRTGIYAPLTKSGTVVVNDCTFSNYIAMQKTSNVVLGGIPSMLSHHQYCHIGLAPLRLYCSLFALCNTYNDDGMPPFVEFGTRISHAAFEQNTLVQFLYMASFLTFAGGCYCLLETPVGLLVAGALLLLRYHRKGSNLAKKSPL